jgi:hypothetical protein
MFAKAFARATGSILHQGEIEIVRHLLAAKEVGESQARDPNVSEVTADDSAILAAKADRAIRELIHGFDVPQAELADALEVPPRHLSLQEKTDLIRQLEDAKSLDDHYEQELLNDYFSNRLVDTDKFDNQKKLVDEVVKDLEVGEDVHWSTIQAALKIPVPSN